ncbi:hypothetical protein F5Y14DRAFT_463568 [Nemania sp. NC0429]|nr:hypothetical protein F5Y14DRAFT_463568 [Nemania sp. NC0429]
MTGGDQNGDHWSVHTDVSVLLPADMSFEYHMMEYRWCAIEVTSPALWVSDESWEEIRAVVRALRDEYWLLTPDTAGLHFHYGNGKSYIPFGKLRRMAALLLAVDPIMAQLHPEDRRWNDYCLSNRLYSRIAHGRPAADAARDIGVEYVEEEPEFPSTTQRRPEPASRPFRRRTADLIVPFKRGTLKGYTFHPDTFGSLEILTVLADNDSEGSAHTDDSSRAEPTTRAENKAPLAIPYAVREILQCLNAPTVAELMRHSPFDAYRLAYNFHAYKHDRYKKMIKENGEIVAEYQHKRTIEFRQMASTMEPDEVVAHGKVAVRLCEFAAEADLEELWRIVLDCTVAEVHGDWYDVFDLLAELGLNDEARVLQYSVAWFRGETIPDVIIDDEEEVAGEEAERGSEWLKWLCGFATCC